MPIAERKPVQPRRDTARLYRMLAFTLALGLLYLLIKPHGRDSSARPPSADFRRYMADPHARLVAYSPVRSEHSSASLTEVHAQLKKLRERFDGLVLYTSDDQTDQILATAASLGYRGALLTIWDPTSRTEIRTATRLANDFQDKLALAVSIGSEGLMEQRYTEADLRSAAQVLERDISGERRIEITTTESWWMYSQQTEEGEQLRTFGDFLAPNIHVLWDTDITDPEEAAHWTLARAADLQASTSRPVLVREAGIPGQGASPRAGSKLVFTRDKQAAFWRCLRGMQDLPHQRYIPVVTFEGIDNPTKTWNAFEGSWGVLDHDMRPYPAWFVFPTLNAGAPKP